MDAISLDSVTEAQLADIESGDPVRMAAALGLEAPKKQQDAATPAGNPTPATVKPNESAPGGNGEEDGSGLNRVSIKALPPAARLKLVEAISRAREGGDFEAILRDSFGVQPAAAAPAQPASQQEPASPAAQPAAIQAPEVVALETKLAGLKTKYDAAKATYDPAANDLLEEMMEVKLDLRDAKREAARESAEHAVFMTQQKESYERVQEQYADLMTDPDSHFMRACDAMISLAERNKDPLLTQPDWPEKIAKQVKELFFKTPAAQSAAPGDKPQTTIPPAPKSQVRLPGSPVGPAFAPGSITPETALAEFDKLTPEQQEATLTEIAKVTSQKR